MYKADLEKMVVEYVYPDRLGQDEQNRADFYSAWESEANDLLNSVRTMKENGMTISNAWKFQKIVGNLIDLSSMIEMHVEQAEELGVKKRGGSND